jgi:hypothetical protein
MGWVQVENISGLVNVCFDARSIQDDTVRNLVDLLAGYDRKTEARLFSLRVYTGRTWFKQTSTDLVQFIEMLLQIREFSEVPAVPTAIRADNISLAGLDSVADPAVRDLFALWRSGGRSRADLEPFLSGRLLDRSTKVLVRDGPSYVFDRYSMDPRAPWDPRTRERFWHRRIEDAVPDRGLARSVSVAADATLAAGMPRLERCSGPIRSADRQIGLYDWFRLTLPLEPANRQGGGSPEVLMAVWN